MQRNRYILCLLACGFMLYIAAPHLEISAPGAQGIFSAAWLLFALLVIAGNLLGLLLFAKKQHQPSEKSSSKQLKKRSRFYN